MKPSICILGCGEHAKRVLSEKDYSQEFNLYFASHDKNKAKTYSDKYKGLDYFESYSKALSDKRIDAAYFLTPHNVHLSNVQLAAKNGIHVLMEKPIARNLEEVALTLIDAGVDIHYRVEPYNMTLLMKVAQTKKDQRGKHVKKNV